MDTPTDMMSSCIGSLKNRYLNVVSRFWNPLAPVPVGPPGAKRCVQVGPTEIAKASVMRFEYSPEISSSLTGGSPPLFVIAMVGTASSSLTPGSSIASVAGKKRLPAISCAAAAPARDASTSASAGAAGPGKRIDMGLLQEALRKFGREWRRPRNGRNASTTAAEVLGAAGPGDPAKGSGHDRSHPGVRRHEAE